MEKLLLLSGVKGDTRRYRAFHAWEQLRLAGVPVELAHIMDPGVEEKVKNVGALILQRVPYDRKVNGIIQQVRAEGGLVLSDTDDLTFDPQAFHWIDSPDFKDPVRAQVYQETILRNRKTLLASDGVITSTKYLAEQVSCLGVPVRVHRNGFSQEMLICAENAFLQKEPHPEKVVIGYASGTPTHNHDFELIWPVLMTVLARFPQVELEIIGPLALGTGWKDFPGRIHRRAFMPWRELPMVLANWDINLAPLRSDNPFSLAKSEIKWLEAGLVRVPTIASQTEAFQSAINPGENGFFAKEGVEWEEYLAKLIADPDCRQELGVRAYQDAMEKYCPELRSRELVGGLNELCESVGKELAWESNPKIGNIQIRIDPRIELHPTNIQRGWYELKQRGLWTVIRQIWVFFRRLAAPIVPF